MQEAKRRKGTSLMGWRMGLRMGRRMLEVRTSMPRETVEAKKVRGICLKNWAWLHCYLLDKKCKDPANQSCSSCLSSATD